MKAEASYFSNGASNLRSLFDSPLFISTVLFSLILIVAWKDINSYHVDSKFYIGLFKGEAVMKPFSGRILYPYFAHLIQRVSGLPLEQSFVLANSFALMLLIYTITVILKKVTSCAAIALPVMFAPLLIRSFILIYLPDFFSAALTGLFFLLVYNSFFWFSLSILLLIYLTRENGLFLCLSSGVVGYYINRPKWAIGSLIVLMLAILITSIAASFGATHPYKMSQLIYLALKIPKNFLYNAFGILIWTNIYPDIGHPYLTLALPSWLPFGALHTIGICPFDPLIPLRTYTLLLTTFGIAPSLLTLILLKNGKQIVMENQFWLAVALLYGLSSFVVGFEVSLDVMRLIGYAWPAFWLATPALLRRYYKLDQGSILQLITYHISLVWLPWLLTPQLFETPWLFEIPIRSSIWAILLVISSIIIFHYLSIKKLSATYAHD
jgi:hypothetical protein